MGGTRGRLGKAQGGGPEQESIGSSGVSGCGWEEGVVGTPRIYGNLQYLQMLEFVLECVLSELSLNIELSRLEAKILGEEGSLAASEP